MRETASVMTPAVLVATGSHVGRVRARNEDRVFADPERGSFAVIDGVGGQAAGELAAQTALDTIRQRLQLQIGTPAERVREAIALANDQIHQHALAHPDRRGMACVLTLVLLQNGTLTAGHVGDTRLYKMRGGTLRKLTHDHSPIGEREDRGELTESEAMRHPRRNEVYREVGVEPRGPDDEGFIELIEEPFEPDAALLLCSDGLSDALASAAIAGIIDRHAGDPTLVVDTLIARANETSGKDNISVVYVEGQTFGRESKAQARARATEDGMSAREDHPHPAVSLRERETANQAGGPAGRQNAAQAAKPAGTAAGSRAAVSTTITAAKNAAASADNQAGRSTRTLTTGHVIGFIAGLLIGVAIALGAAWWMRDALLPVAAPTAATPPRVLLVGTSADATYRTIGEAMAAARAGDTIQVGPGEYREQVVVPDGVTLIGSPARAAVLRAPLRSPPAPASLPPAQTQPAPSAAASARPSASPSRQPPQLPSALQSPAVAQAMQSSTALIVSGGRQGSRVSGLTIAADAQNPLAFGVQVLGRATVDDLEISGTTTAGLVLAASGAVTIAGSFFHDNAGPGLTWRPAFDGGSGDARLTHNVFLRNGAATPPGVDVVLQDASDAARYASGDATRAAAAGVPQVVFVGNVISGDPAQRVRGLTTAGADRAARFRETNIILPPAPAARPRAGTPRRAPR